MALLNNHKKLKGSTLIEVIAAMLITMITFGIAMVVVINCFKSAGFGTKFKARIVLNNMVVNVSETQQYYDKDTIVDGMKVTQKVTPYVDNKKLSHVSLVAFNQEGRVIDKIEQLILMP